jgi:hypothetical protein
MIIKTTAAPSIRGGDRQQAVTHSGSMDLPGWDLSSYPCERRGAIMWITRVPDAAGAGEA